MSSDAQTVPGARASSTAFDLVRDRAWMLTVGTAMLVWTITLFALVRDRYVNFRLPRYDLGNMVQAVWNTAQGRPLEWTDGATGEQMVRLGAHVDPILAALAPLWILAPTPLTLVAVQIVAVAFGALPVFWLARRHLKSEGAATLLALAYLAYPWMTWAAVDVFHPVALAIPLFLLSVWFLDTGRLAAFAPCAVLALATGDLMGLPLAALGLWYAVARGKRRAGLAIAALSAAWTLIVLYVVVPAFAGESSRYYGAFNEVGGSPRGLIETAFTDPGAVLSTISRANDLLYILALTAPLGAAFLLAPGLAAVALPLLTVNLLSGLSATTSPYLHYVAGIVPFLFAAVAIGLGRLSTRGRVRGAFVVLTLSLGAALAAGPWPGPLGGTPAWYWDDVSPAQAQALQRAVALVPDGAPVSSTNRVGSHLAARRYLYSVPVVGRAEWIVLDSSDAWIPRRIGGYPNPEALRAFQERIGQSPEWHKVFDEDGVLVFRKVQA